MYTPRPTNRPAAAAEGLAQLIAILPALGVATRDVAASRRVAPLVGELAAATFHRHADQHGYDPEALLGGAIDTYRELRQLPHLGRLAALGDAAGHAALKLLEPDPCRAAVALADLAAAAVALDPAPRP